jgi:hypothetical protein
VLDGFAPERTAAAQVLDQKKSGTRLNPVSVRADGRYWMRCASVQPSGQEQIGERDQGGADAGCDQGVVGTHIITHLKDQVFLSTT